LQYKIGKTVQAFTGSLAPILIDVLKRGFYYCY